MRTYLWTFGGLLVLTTLTLLLSFAHLGAWSPVVALTIAVAKSLLVVLWFMHLVEQRASNWIALLIGVLLLATLIGLAALDVESRRPLGPPGLAARGGPAFRAPSGGDR